MFSKTLNVLGPLPKVLQLTAALPLPIVASESFHTQLFFDQSRFSVRGCSMGYHSPTSWNRKSVSISVFGRYTSMKKSYVAALASFFGSHCSVLGLATMSAFPVYSRMTAS